MNKPRWRRSTVSDETLTVRRAMIDDWAALRTIRLEALLDAPDAFGTTFGDAATYPDDRWRELAAGYRYFLAERAGVVIGMSSTGLNDQHPDTHWLYGMYVTPGARGSGVAEALVGTVSSWVKSQGASELYLHVTSSVGRANAFYRRLGFVPTGESFRMPRKPELVLVSMVKTLD